MFSEGRRRFLTKFGVFVAGAGGLAIPVSAANYRHTESPAIELWPRPNDIRQIWLKRSQTGEESVIRYYDGRQVVQSEYFKACTLLRDVRANEAAAIDLVLLDLMFVMQKWLVTWGIDRPLVVSSGFRNKSTNNSTEGAARNSMHLKGRAADIRMPGMTTDYLGKLAAVFGKGGVGFYTGQGFVHIDTGRVRYWQK